MLLTASDRRYRVSGDFLSFIPSAADAALILLHDADDHDNVIDERL